MADGDPNDAIGRQEIQGSLDAVRQSSVNLTTDIVNGRYSQQIDDDGNEVQTAEEGENKLFNRLGLWLGTALGMYNLGVMTPADGEQTIEWVYDPSKEHCITCRALDGVVLTKDEWQRIPHRPQGNTLECGGFNCGCEMRRSDRPSRGLENVPTPGMVVFP